jgi:carbohydrate-selective porin OprB
MIFNSPNKYSFKIYLPKFIPPAIALVFNDYLFKETLLPYNNVHDALFESQIMGYDIPELGITSVNQVTGKGDISQLQSLSTYEQFGDRRISIKFRTLDGFLNFNLARYAYYLYASPKLNDNNDKTGVLGDIIIVFNTTESLFSYKIIYKNVIWLNVDGKSFEYDATIQEPDTFSMMFKHNGFEIIPIINETIAKSKGLQITIN